MSARSTALIVLAAVLHIHQIDFIDSPCQKDGLICGRTYLRDFRVTAYSTSRFKIRDVTVIRDNGVGCCKANSTCPCELQLSFCAGVHFPEKKQYKDCHYIHFQTPFITPDDFPYNADVPISIRWPVTEWQLTVTAHDRLGNLVLEVSRFFRNISSHSPVTDMTIEAKNVTVSFSFSVDCEPNFYGPACTIFCNETFKDQNGGSFKCSPEGKKICESGWTGSLCNEPKCEQDCVHGTCIGPNICRCDFGWKGDFCTECVPLAGCQHGYCRTAHRCECMKNWGGLLCDIDLDYCSNHKDLCKNGGVCLSDDANLYKCNCSDGFEGRNCEKRKELDCTMLDCGVGVCQAGKAPRCECPPDRSGTHCEYIENAMKTTFRIDVLLISVAILILAVCLAVLSVLIRFICEKLDLIQKGGQAIPFYTAHWVAAEFHVRERSSSPPPTYDTYQTRSPGKTWRKGSTEFLEITV